MIRVPGDQVTDPGAQYRSMIGDPIESLPSDHRTQRDRDRIRAVVGQQGLDEMPGGQSELGLARDLLGQTEIKGGPGPQRVPVLPHRVFRERLEDVERAWHPREE